MLVNESYSRIERISLDLNHFSPKIIKSCKSNKKLSSEFQSVIDKGLVEELKIKEDEQQFKQLRNFEWPSIPMFSVLTGLYGISKSSVFEVH
jgi:hypothetical protein